MKPGLTDGFLGVRVEHGGTVDLGHDLVGHHHGDTVLVSQAKKRTQELGKVHLTRRELPTA